MALDVSIQAQILNLFMDLQEQFKTSYVFISHNLAVALDNRIVYERNGRFVTRVTSIAAPNRPVFVAIGSLHLGGPKWGELVASARGQWRRGSGLTIELALRGLAP